MRRLITSVSDSFAPLNLCEGRFPIRYSPKFPSLRYSAPKFAAAPISHPRHRLLTRISTLRRYIDRMNRQFVANLIGNIDQVFLIIF